MYLQNQVREGRSDITVSLLLTVAVGGVGGRGLAGEQLSPREQLVLDHRPLLHQRAPQQPRVLLRYHGIHGQSPHNNGSDGANQGAVAAR